MALRLMVEGRVVEQAEAYCMTDAEVARVMAARRPPRLPPAEAPAFVAQRDVVAGYLAKGVIRPEQARAAQEIAAHWYAVTRALHARCGLYAERMPKGPEQDHPADAPRTARYLRWAEWANTQRVTPAASLVDLTLDVAVDGLSWSGIRTKRRIGDHRAKREIQRSLWHYALGAGWVEERPAQRAA
jgi:hypothetical protein